MSNTLTIKSHFNTLDKVSQLILNKFQKSRIFALTGTLGAGKTTLIRSLLSHYGISILDVTSPTFTYYNIYKNSNSGKDFYHFDLYRLHSIDAFCDMGFEEIIFDKRNIIFIEWPDIILPLLNDGVCRISIDYTSEINQRIFTIFSD